MVKLKILMFLDVFGLGEKVILYLIPGIYLIKNMNCILIITFHLLHLLSICY